ncbi:hypothetical protein Tco_1439735 [Tanacetum coccineum]
MHPFVLSFFRGIMMFQSSDVVDLPLVEKLNENRTLIRKYSEVFLSIIGLSYSFIDTEIRPAFIGRDKNDMGLLDFVKFANPFKVKVGERTLPKNEVLLLTETEDRVIALSGQTLRLMDHTIMDELRGAAGKKNRKVSFSAGPPPEKKDRAGSIVISKPNLTTIGKTSATLRTLEHECHDESGSTHGGNVRTGPAYDRFVILTSIFEPMDTDAIVFPKVISPITCVQIEAEAAAAGPKAECEAADVVVLRKRVFEMETAAAAKAEELAGLSVQMMSCWGRYPDSDLSGLGSIRDELKSQVSKLEADCEGLCGEIASEAKMRAEIKSIQDAEAQRITQWNVELDARIAELNYDMDTKFYPHMLKAVARRRWMIGHGLRLAVMKCSQSTESLVELEAYDSRVEVGYVSAVNELKNVSFSLLDKLKPLKNSLLELLMPSLTLEGDHGEEDPTHEFRILGSHEILLSDALAALHACGEKRKNGVLLSLETGGPSVVMLFASSQETSLVDIDYQILSVTIVDGIAPATEPHADLFDTTLLDKPVYH